MRHIFFIVFGGALCYLALVGYWAWNWEETWNSLPLWMQITCIVTAFLGVCHGWMEMEDR